MRKTLCLLAVLGCTHFNSSAQKVLSHLGFTADSLAVSKIAVGEKEMSLPKKLSLVSFILNKKQFATDASGNHPTKQLKIRWEQLQSKPTGMQGVLLFQNTSNDTITLENIVPFGIAPEHVYITGKGDHYLSRTHLFVPGKLPVNVIVPDNAWDMGYCSFKLTDDVSVVGMVRRDRASIDKGKRTRFETILYPGGSVKYNFYAETSGADWRQSLTQVFQNRMLYDIENFDNSLFEREDLKWIRHAYVMHLFMAWDKFYYDYKDGKHHVIDFINRGKKLYGGDDIISLWPTWPTLGLDQRNQFDLFRDLPGGTKGIRELAEQLHKNNSKLFVCYNPWDESTRS
jgi:gamma-glutamyl hercynylcysteine S-oxide synthase